MLYKYSIKQSSYYNNLKGKRCMMRKQKGLRSSLAIIFSVIALVGLTANAETLEVKNKGYVDITGNGAVEKSVVTLEITADEFNLSDENTWNNSSDDGSKTEFMGAVQADEKGAYEFNVFLKKSGKYIARIGNTGFDKIKENQILFINEDSLSEKFNKLKTAAEANNLEKIKEIIENNRFDIGIFSSVGADADFGKAASFMCEYLKKKPNDVNENSIGVIGEKACVLSILTSDGFKGFGQYKDGFGIGDLEVSKFYKDAFASELTAMMKSDDPQTIEQYNNAAEKNIILCLIKLGDSAGDVKDCLELYADKIGVNKSKITTDMCRALMNENNINDYSDIKKFAESFGAGNGSQNGGGSGRGSSGGGYSGKGSDNTPKLGDKTYSDEYMPKNNAESAVIFDDIKDYEWAQEAITGLFGKGILTGREPKKFMPGDSVLREEFVKIIVKSFELSVVGSNPSFQDVEEGAWYKGYVDCAYNSGIVNGLSDTEFGTGKPILREDIAVMISRAVNICDYKFKNNGDSIDFADSDEISDYAKEAVDKLSAAGIISGDENRCFNPKQSATRAETAKLLWAVIQTCEK